MESLLTQITNYLLAQSWQIAVLTIVIAVISFLLRNRSAHIRYILWLIVLAKCFVPSLYTIPIAVLPRQEKPAYTPAQPITESMISEPEIAVTELPMLSSDQPESMSSSAIAERQAKYDSRALLAIGWLAGVVALSFYYLLNALRTQIWLQMRRKELPSEYKKNIESLFITHGVQKIPRIWLLERISQPFVWGMFRGNIYLPAEMINEKHAKFHTSLLGHELSHVIRFDALINSLQVIAQAIFWFHPFVWWANRKIRAEREKCCDEMTIAGLNALPEEYSEAIVDILAAKYEQARPVPSLAVAGQVKNIEERIKIIMKPEKRFYKKPSFKVTMIILIFASLIIPTTFVLTARGSAGGDAGISGDSDTRPDPAISDISPTPKLDDPEDWIPKANGCLIEQTGSKIHIVGTNNIDGWGHGNGITYNRALPEGDFYVCVDFMVPRFSGPGNTLVYLRAKSITGVGRMIAILFQPNGIYQLQSWAGENGSEMTYGGSLRNFGDEDEKYHRMKLKYDSDAKTAFGWIDDKFIGYLNHTQIYPVKIEVIANTEAKGMQIDLLFDNLYISTDVSEASPIPVSASMIMAVTSGDIEKVKSLISEETGQDAKNAALQEACSVGELEIVKLMIENGADINARSQRGPALYHAMMANHKQIAELLISKGADVNMKNNGGLSILHFACQIGNKEIAEVLIDNGADIDAKNNGDYTALINSATSSQKDIVEFLLDKGADIEAKQEHGATALACVAYNGNTEMAKFLLEHGADIEAKLYEGTTPLLRAIIEGHLETATLLLEKGADANVTLNGLTTLQLAMIGSGFANKNSNPEIVKLLLQHGLESPQIHLAACFGDIKKIEDYLKDGTKIDEKDTANFTALHYAVSGGHVDVVKFLLSNGANINAKSINGWTPLRFTLSAKMAELLITNGADVNISDNKGQTVLHGAVNQDHSRGNKELVELLVEHGADINAKTTEKSVDWEGWTPFHVTCRNGNLEIVKLLIEHGADINAKTDKGNTPLSLAQAENRRAVVQLLRENGATE